MAQLSDFKEIWIVDFEFQISEGRLPDVHCMVAREARSNRLIRAFREELLAADEAPFDVGNDALFVAYYSSAEFGCFLFRLASAGKHSGPLRRIQTCFGWP